MDDAPLLWAGGLAIVLVVVAGYLLHALQDALDYIRAKRASPPLFKKNRQGFVVNDLGYDVSGLHWETGRDSAGYDALGFSEEGYNREGFNQRGFDKWGNHESGAKFSDTTGLDVRGKNIHGNFPRTDEELATSLTDYQARGMRV